MRGKLYLLIGLIIISITSLNRTMAFADSTDNTNNNQIYPKSYYSEFMESPFQKKLANEEINYITGELQVSQTDLLLKGRNGLDFSLTRYYSSSQANLYEPYTYLTINGDRREAYHASTVYDKFFDLGNGWSFDLPFIEKRIQDNAAYEYLHLGRYGTWTLTTTNEIRLQDMVLSPNTSYSNGEMSSERVLEMKDGKKYYFGTDGRLLGIKDRFGNEIKFFHTMKADINGQQYPVITKVIDSVGREINITYLTNQILVSVQDSQNPQNNRNIYYNKVEIADKPGEYNLENVVDAEGNTTRYEYSNDLAKASYIYSILNDNMVNNYYSNLTKIIYPTGGETKYSYGKFFKHLGINGVMTFYKVTERSDYKLDTSVINYKKVNYGKFAGHYEYDGFPDYSFGNDATGYLAETQVLDTSLNSSTYVEKYVYNTKLKLVEEWKEGTDHKVNIRHEYDSSTNLLTHNTYDIYNKATNQIMSKEEFFAYDAGTIFNPRSFGDLIGYWDFQAGSTSDTEHKITYEYHPQYHYVISKTYKKDANTTIRVEYTPTASDDGKTVEWEKVYENNILKKQLQYLYDSFGNLTEKRDYLSNWTDYVSTKYSYLDNNPTRNPNLDGAYLTRKWNEGIKDVDGNLITPKGGNPNGVIDEVYKYDLFGNLIEAQDGIGNITTYEYDKLDRKTKEIYPDSTFKTWFYNIADNTTTITDENNSRILYGYDEFGHLLYTKDLATNNFINQYEYDEKSRLKKEYNNNRTKVIEYFYNSDGRINKKEVRDNLSNIIYSESYTYDDAYNSGQYAKITKVIVGDLSSPSITTNTYQNKLGQLEKQERIHTENGTNKSYVDTFKYNYVDNKLEVKSSRANDENWTQPYTSKYEYDFEGKLVKEYNVNNIYSSIGYDTLGRIVSKTDMKGNTTTFVYDDLGRVIKETLPFEVVSGITYNTVKKHYYDRSGKVVQEKVSKNKSSEAEAFNQTQYEYNGRNLLTKVITYNNGAPENYAQYYYDAAGNKIRMYTGLRSPLQINGLDNVTSTGDADYSVTKYEYNQFNKLSKLIDPLGNIETYSYDPDGNLTQIIDRNNNTITMNYDTLNRLISKNATSLDSSANVSSNFSFNLTGNKSSMAQGASNTTYVYDDLGRLKSETEANGIVKEYAYDANNNLVSFVLKQGGVIKINTTYTYDNLNRLSQVVENGVTTATYQYDLNGNRTSLSYNNGNSVEYVYNLANKLTRLVNKKGANTVSQFDYAYYLSGNQESKNDVLGNKINNYIYDGLGRLNVEIEKTNGITTSTVNYSFDDYNNRASMDVSGTEAYTDTYSYDKNSRLLAETKETGGISEITSYNYDGNGNQIYKSKDTLKASNPQDADSFSMTIAGETEDAVSKESTFNEYDGFNQLTKVIIGSKVTTYTYSAEGLRQSKVSDGTTTNHIWRGQDIVLETDGAGNITSKYIRGINLIYGEDGIGSKTYYLFNGHGDTIHLTDVTGNVIKNYDYDAFGNEKNIDVNDKNVFRYSAEYFDRETGTYYLRARYYNPVIGRFSTEDPIKDGLNWYTYCGNNPVNGWDPSGLKNTGEIVKWGSSSTLDVKIIQMRLNDLGYKGKNGKALSVDGDFKTNTDYAVRQYQKATGLQVDGKVGDTTWRRMGLMLDTDVTNKLYMESIKGIYENVLSYLPEGTRLPDKPDAGIMYLFYDMVRNKGPMDLKQKPEWQSAYFIFDGKIVTSDAPGNISYGITGRILNIDEDTLLMAAGMAQIKSGTSKTEWRNGNWYGDDPMDQINIRIGFKYFDKKVGK